MGTFPPSKTLLHILILLSQTQQPLPMVRPRKQIAGALVPTNMDTRALQTKKRKLLDEIAEIDGLLNKTNLVGNPKPSKRQRLILKLPSLLLKLPPELRQAIVANLVERITVSGKGQVLYGEPVIRLICKTFNADLAELEKGWIPPPDIHIRCLEPDSLKYVPTMLRIYANLAEGSGRVWQGTNLELMYRTGNFVELVQRPTVLQFMVQSDKIHDTAFGWTVAFERNLPTGNSISHRIHTHVPMSARWEFIRSIRYNIDWPLPTLKYWRPAHIDAWAGALWCLKRNISLDGIFPISSFILKPVDLLITGIPKEETEIAQKKLMDVYFASPPQRGQYYPDSPLLRVMKRFFMTDPRLDEVQEAIKRRESTAEQYTWYTNYWINVRDGLRAVIDNGSGRVDLQVLLR